MLQAEYESLVDELQIRKDVFHVALRSNGKYSTDTLLAIYDQSCILRPRRYHSAIRNGDKIVKQYNRGMSLITLAELYRVPPCLMARRFLEINPASRHVRVGRLLRDPDEFIEDERIRREVKVCVENDDVMGPFIDRRRAVTGLEYEFMLLDKLRSIGLEFETEEELRARGTHKTPDILLRTPVAIDGRTVRWIESKGKYGDKFFLCKDYSDAISSYVGRFGSGMVIYWLGFTSDCDESMLDDRAVYVVDKFPATIQVLRGSTVGSPNSANS